MAHFEIEEAPPPHRIDMASSDSHERETSHVGGQLSAIPETGNRLQPRADDQTVNEGVTNDPQCTPCLQFHNCICGVAKGIGSKLFSCCCSCVPVVKNPHTKVVQRWNQILAFCCLVAIFVDPLCFFLIYVKEDHKCIAIYKTTAKVVFTIIRSIFDLGYLCNIAFQFRLAYVSPESGVVLIDNPREIALNYLKGYLLWDIIVVLPLPQIMLWVRPIPLSGANHAGNLLFGLLQYIPRLWRFLRLLYGVYSPRGFIFESVYANVAINLLNFILAGHVVGCCWYLFGLQRVHQCLQDACHRFHLHGCKELINCDSYVSKISPWSNSSDAIACLNSTSGAFSYGIFANVVEFTTRTNLVNKYLYALFWGFQQISTLAGNQTPSNYEGEVIFTMVIIGSGLLLFALLIENIHNLLQGLGRRTLEKQLQSRDVEQWMNLRRLPKDLKKRIRHSEWYSSAAIKGTEKMVLENSPDDIQTDIRRHLFEYVKNVRIFDQMDEPSLDAIRERIKRKTYIKGSIILHQGDGVGKMVFIVHGRLECVRDGFKYFLEKGDACGQELLKYYIEHSSASKDGKKVKPAKEVLKSNTTVRCLTNVEAFSLHAADIEEVATLFESKFQSPRVQAVIRDLSYDYRYRSHVAQTIQVAWRYRMKRLIIRAALTIQADNSGCILEIQEEASVSQTCGTDNSGCMEIQEEASQTRANTSQTDQTLNT